MIEQYTIATTPRYNFPSTAFADSMPQRLMELSIYSLKNSRSQGLIQLDNRMETPASVVKLKPKQIRPRIERTTVAAIDTSCIKIGETRSGFLIAIRGANVWKQKRTCRYARIGPFIFHVTEENKKEVYNMLQKEYFGRKSCASAPNLTQMPTRLASLLERWLQLAAAKSMDNSLILIDGSLVAGTPEAPTCIMREILEKARKMENAVLAFSKVTTIRLDGDLITDIVTKYAPPCLLELDGLSAKPPQVSFGNIYVARLASVSSAFRLDIDKELPNQKQIESVEKLVGNDVFSQGYPETLRLAHILCTFTANEVIAMQHFAMHRYGLKIITRPDMHRLLFGPFGKGEENA